MKLIIQKLFLAFFISLNIYSQQEKMVVIVPVTTYSYYVNEDCIYLPINCPMVFNDAGLQAIFDTHSVAIPQTGAYMCGVFSGYNAVEIQGMSSTTNPAFTQDLLDYTQGVVGIDYLPGQPYSVIYSLINSLDGAYVNTVNGVVVTNNALLNQVFVDYNVFNITEYTQQNEILCNCNGIELSNALNNLSSIIDYAFDACSVVTLNNDQFLKPNATVYPNPFEDNLNIETTSNITLYCVYDSFGRKVIETKSKDVLSSNLSKLNSAVYLLKLIFENETNQYIKLLKN